MNTEFRSVIIPDEIQQLLAFDRRIFPVADRFPADYWMKLHSFWLLVDGVKAGCCAFEHDVDFQVEEPHLKRAGSLYIASTGILPRFQGFGLGRLMKCWQIAYAHRNRFRRIVTNTRKRNRPMIRLNQQFGFRIIRIVPGYYSDPVDATVVMELRIARRRVKK
jgi:ribosomal protein S18 acetylase RimI-like enzyme